MTDTDTGGWPLGEVLANSYKLAIKEAAELKALNAELLAALKACIPVLQKVDHYEGVFDIFVQARAAMAKAKELTE